MFTRGENVDSSTALQYSLEVRSTLCYFILFGLFFTALHLLPLVMQVTLIVTD